MLYNRKSTRNYVSIITKFQKSTKYLLYSIFSFLPKFESLSIVFSLAKISKLDKILAILDFQFFSKIWKLVDGQTIKNRVKSIFCPFLKFWQGLIMDKLLNFGKKLKIEYNQYFVDFFNFGRTKNEI